MSVINYERDSGGCVVGLSDLPELHMYEFLDYVDKQGLSIPGDISDKFTVFDPVRRVPVYGVSITSRKLYFHPAFQNFAEQATRILLDVSLGVIVGKYLIHTKNYANYR